MYSLVPKKTLSFFTVLLSVSLAFANEGGGEAAAQEGAKEVKSREDSFAVVQARVAALEAKVRSGEAEIQKLILEKQTSKDPARVSEIISSMVALHKDMEKNLKEYDQQRTLLKYRYPEKGAAAKREYERIDIKSIEEMENQMSLGSSVKRTLKKVRSQYSSAQEREQHKAVESHEEAGKAAPTPTPGLVDPVILKK